VTQAFRYRELMVSGSIDRAILHLGAPAAMSALLQAGFLVVDAFWLGRVGPVALAAASTAGFMMWLAQTLGEGAASGSGAVLARAVGESDGGAACRAAAAGQTLGVWGSAVVSAGGLLVSHVLFAFMRTAPGVTVAGLHYMWVILLGMPAYFLFAWLSAAFRAVGDAKTPLKLLALAAAVNLATDPILIFGIGPVPALGVTGAALATVLSWLVASVRGWILLGRLGLRPAFFAFLKPPRRETWRALQVGMPIGLEGALFSLIYILLTRVITSFGTSAVAALGVGHKLEVLNYFVCAGMGAAASTLVAQNLGAGVRWRGHRCGHDLRSPGGPHPVVHGCRGGSAGCVRGRAVDRGAGGTRNRSHGGEDPACHDPRGGRLGGRGGVVFHRGDDCRQGEPVGDPIWPSVRTRIGLLRKLGIRN
jgi:putative MATE family efflux protein